MSRSNERCLNIIELGKYFRISYDKAMDIANIPSFPRAIFMNEKPFPKAQIIAWAAQRLDPQLLESNETINPTSVIKGKRA